MALIPADVNGGTALCATSFWITTTRASSSPTVANFSVTRCMGSCGRIAAAWPIRRGCATPSASSNALTRAHCPPAMAPTTTSHSDSRPTPPRTDKGLTGILSVLGSTVSDSAKSGSIYTAGNNIPITVERGQMSLWNGRFWASNGPRKPQLLHVGVPRSVKRVKVGRPRPGPKSRSMACVSNSSCKGLANTANSVTNSS